jgi:hypothetical protein
MSCCGEVICWYLISRLVCGCSLILIGFAFVMTFDIHRVLAILSYFELLFRKGKDDTTDAKTSINPITLGIAAL